MSVSFVLPDGTSTDILGQTIPRFPVRTPDDFVRLSEIARDRRALAQVPGHQAGHGAGPGAQRAGQGAQASRCSYAEATYFPIHAYLWVTLAGHGTWVRYRLVPQADAARPPGGPLHRPRPAARRDAGPAGAGAGEVRPRRHRRRAEGRPARPDVGLEGQPRVRRRAGSRSPRPRTTTRREGDVVVFDPTRVVDGIELSDDPILRYRPSAYSVSIERRSHPR